nr:helix-turn-helix transcriptional regulator [Providencia stuartii]ELR5084463.1 helix-turn-helix transcriptional regulator [Providencia stuartii]
MNNLYYFDECSGSDMRTVFTQAIGQEIYRIRRNRSITGKELAKELNVSQQQVSRYERGVCNITVDTLILILSILNMPVDEFFKHVYLNVSEKHALVDERYCQILLSLDQNNNQILEFN